MTAPAAADQGEGRPVRGRPDAGDPVEVDAAMIGTGQAAPSLAVALAGRGQRVVVFEGGRVGGSCVNVGCTPTKALRKSARVAQMARRAAEFGVRTGEVEVDFAAAMERMAGIATASRDGLTSWMDGTPGLTLVREFARFDGRAGDRFVVRSASRVVHARRVFLNTGARPILPALAGVEEVPCLTNETLLALRERPTHLLILGGSYIGLELGQIFRRLGSEVTIIEHGPTVASREDPDISARLEEVLRGEGVQILAGHDAQSVRRVDDRTTTAAIALGVRAADGTMRELRGTHLLAATGRRPNTDALGLEMVGVARDARGYVTTNGRLETNVPGIWALGDMNGRGAFTHTSYQDHEIVAANLAGGDRSADGRIPTYAMYTDPPFGRVGLTQREARSLVAQGRRFLVAEHEMRLVSRAKEEGETYGVMRLIVDAESHRFVGATLLGISGDEIVQLIGALMAAGAPFEVLRDALPIHPTVTEFLPTILGKLAPLT